MFSIILPVYNSERFISNTIESVLNQTFKDYELIIINDGSTDKTFDICKKYSEDNKNIYLINQKNLGASEARNKGIYNAKNEYLIFLDSDDELDSDFLEVLNRKLESNKVDVLFFGFKLIEDGRVRKNILDIKSNDFKNIIYELISNDVFGYQCCKAIKRNIIIDNNICLDKKISINEDLVFTCNILDFTSKIDFYELAGYNYLIRKDSLSRRFNANIIIEQNKVFSIYSRFLISHNIRNKEKLLINRAYLSLMVIFYGFINNTIIINKKNFSDLKNSSFYKYIDKYNYKKDVRGRRKYLYYILKFSNFNIFKNFMIVLIRKFLNN